MQITTPLGLEEVDIIGIDGKENPTDTEDLEVRCSRHPLIPVEEVIEGISQHDQRHHQRARELEQEAHHTTIARTKALLIILEAHEDGESHLIDGVGDDRDRDDI